MTGMGTADSKYFFAEVTVDGPLRTKNGETINIGLAGQRYQPI